MSYGGPAIMGIMQVALQARRNWFSKKEFVEGLALMNILPGPGATRLGIRICAIFALRSTWTTRWSRRRNSVAGRRQAAALSGDVIR
jgi:hypothetical protein